MSDDVLANALTRRDAALAEARRWDDFIRMYSELTGLKPNMQASEGPSHRPVPQQVSGAISDTERAAKQIIRELGRPVPTRELLGLLAEHGVEVGGQDRASTLSARLSRAPSLENIRQRGWWVKGWTEGSNLGGDMPSVREPHQASLMPDQPKSGPVKPGREVGHEEIDEDF